MPQGMRHECSDGRCEADHVLRAILDQIAGARGHGFFRGLVGAVATVLRLPFVWVSECTDPPGAVPTRVRTLAFWVGRDFGADAEYALAGTPCEDVLRTGEVRAYASALRAAFPDETWLREIAADGYVAAPLVGASGEVLGHLAAIDQKPLANVALLETVLGLLAARAAVDLERRQLELERGRLRSELHLARDREEIARGLITACAWCGNIRGEQEHWHTLEAYVQRRAPFTHGICPDCRRRVTRDGEEAPILEPAEKGTTPTEPE